VADNVTDPRGPELLGKTRAMSMKLTWEAPGGGDWWLVKEHFPNPVSRMFSSLFPAVTLGWKDGGARYGLATGEARWAAVNSWIYYGPQIALTSDELDAREVAAATTLTSSPWRDEVLRWHNEERPRAVAANRALQDEDARPLDDSRLGEHFEATVDNFLRWAPLHFEHTGFDVVAGLLFRAAEGWGVEPTTITELLAGASPASSAVDAHLRTIAGALDRAGAPMPIASIADLRAASTEAAAALDAYLDDYGWRPVAGHDLLEPTLGERLELVVASVNACRGRRKSEPGRDVATAVGLPIPESDREQFDAMLADARSSYALRDDDVGVCWNWPLGLVRRAGLEVGRRLADRNLLADPHHVFEADTDEALTLLSGEHGPTAAELARRWDLRNQAAVEDPPLHLDGGGERSATVDLPPAVARLSEIRNAVWSFAPPRVNAPLHGVGIGSQAAVGTARVVRHPEDLIHVVDGDVLVAVATTTAFNAVFSLLSAVVTEQGGLFSHTAILARELGLPAVVGVPDLFEEIHDGDLIEVDPRAGAVRIVAR
jgi:rifampicin phosphotransferase